MRGLSKDCRNGDEVEATTTEITTTKATISVEGTIVEVPDHVCYNEMHQNIRPQSG